MLSIMKDIARENSRIKVMLSPLVIVCLTHQINLDLSKIDHNERPLDRDVMKDPGLSDKLHKEELGCRKGDYRTVYLMLYNLLQLLGFSYVLAVIAARYMKLGDRSIADTYDHVGSAMKFLQLMQYLEVVHPMLGFTKGGVVVPFFQISGREIILFAIIASEPRMHTKPVVFYLFIVWSLIEVIRYLFYISQLCKKEIYILTWLRYTMWIPLYPSGIICEAIVLITNLPYCEETLRFTVSFPNTWNFAFHMPTAIRVYLLLLVCPGAYFLMRHMYKLREIKLRPKGVLKKS